MKRAIGFIGFAAISFIHCLGWNRFIVLSWPQFELLAGSSLLLLWIAVLGGFYWAMRRNTPAGVFAFVYFIFILTITWRLTWPPDFQGGVPAAVADQPWKDPKHLLTPQTKFILQYHTEVLRVLNEVEYDKCIYGLLCYYTGGLMCFAAFICLPFGDVKLFPRERVKTSRFPAVCFKKGNCSGEKGGGTII
jgi:hypothetical protein